MIHWKKLSDNHEVAVLGYQVWTEILRYDSNTHNPKSTPNSTTIICRVITPTSEKLLYTENFQLTQTKEIEEFIAGVKEYIAAIAPAFQTSLEHTVYRG